MKIVSIIGVRPQFIKAAMLSRAIRQHNKSGSSPKIEEILVHTGQHYDYEMSQIFFDQLEISKPDYHLEIGSGTHGSQTGKMLECIEVTLIKEKPDIVLVYGDTNSTLAGALAAAKLHIPVGHVEGGMRSFNRKMPEEINRVIIDHIATWHFCPNETAVANLKKEGVTEGVYLTGDVMFDSIMLYKSVAEKKSVVLKKLGLKSHALATLHRPENTDNKKNLRSILEALSQLSKKIPVVLPLHPRTKKAISAAGLESFLKNGITITEPMPYIDILKLESSASVILTDSGGMQKEAYWLGVPCVTMREETEWIETTRNQRNIIVGANTEKIVGAFNQHIAMSKSNISNFTKPARFDAGTKIIEILSPYV